MTWPEKWGKAFERVVEVLLSLSLLTMIALGLLGIVARWFSVSFLWINPLIQHLVLVVTFLGGTLASGSRKHLGIDLLSKYLEEHLAKLGSHALVLVKDAFTLFILIWIFKACYPFIQDVYLYEGEGPLGLGQWVWALCIPLGVGAVMVRTFLLVALDLIELKKDFSKGRGN